MEIKRQHQINFWYIIAAILGVLLIRDLLFLPTHLRTIAYSGFHRLVDQDKVSDLVIGLDRISGTYKEPQGAAKEPQGETQHFVTGRVPQDLAETLAKKNLTFSGEPRPGLLQTILSWFLPGLFFILLWWFPIRRMAMGQGAGGLMSIGTGAADDLAKATNIAHSMVTRFGMTKEVGQITYETETSPFLSGPAIGNWQPRSYGEETAGQIDRAVRAIVEKGFERAVSILRGNREILEAGAKELLVHETLGHDNLDKLAVGLKREVEGSAAQGFAAAVSEPRSAR